MTAYSTTFTRPSNVANTPTAAEARCDEMCNGDVEVSWGISANNICTDHVTRQEHGGIPSCGPVLGHTFAPQDAPEAANAAIITGSQH